MLNVLLRTLNALHRRDLIPPGFAKQYYQIPTSKRIIALTFDDGPYPPYTERLLDTLDQYQVKATFFMYGARIERYPETARAVIERGHQVGNHSYSHHCMIVRPLSMMREEIIRTDSLIRNLGYHDAIPFRAPYGMSLFLLPLLLHRLQKTHILFDFYPQPADWQGAPVHRVVQSLVQQTRPGSILVLHDGSPRAAPLASRYTEGLIQQLHAQDYRFVRVDELLKEGTQ